MPMVFCPEGCRCNSQVLPIWNNTMLIKIFQQLQITKTTVYSLVLVCFWTFVISASLIVNSMMKQTGLLCATHAFIWFAGLICLYIGATMIKLRSHECNLAENELRRVNKVLESQATTDSLTGIYNRRKFLELLQMKIRESKRYEVPLELIFFDIDHFKEINDNYGHEAGDSILRELTSLVSRITRQADIFARFGGEEFVILAHNSDVGVGCELAEKIRRAVNQHSFTQVGRVTCSFGVAQYLPEDTTDSIIRRADDAMYTAKKRGRNLVENCCDCQREKETLSSG